MKDDFFIKIETWHKPDLGTTDNVRSFRTSADKVTFLGEGVVNWWKGFLILFSFLAS